MLLITYTYCDHHKVTVERKLDKIQQTTILYKYKGELETFIITLSYFYFYNSTTATETCR